MRNKLSITAIIILAGIAAIVYFVVRLGGGGVNEPMKAIPNDAITILQINKPGELFHEILYNNKNWEALTEFNSIEKMNRQLSIIDSIINHRSDIEKMVHSSPVTVSLHLTGKDHFDLLASIDLPDNQSGKRSVQTLKSLFKDEAVFRERKYENAAIHDWQSTKDNQRLSFSWKKGLLLLSTSPVLLEDAIRQLNVSSNFTNAESFKKIAGTANKNAEGTLFINFTQLENLLQPLLKPSEHEPIRQLSNMSQWMALDIKIQDTYMLLSGYTHSSDSLNHYLHYFNNRSPDKTDIVSLLPSNTKFYSHFNFNNFNEYLAHLNNYQRAHGSYHETNQSINQLNSNYDIDLNAFMKANFGQEGALAFLTDDASSPENQYLMIYKNKGKSQATKAMEDLTQALSKSQNQPLGKFQQTLTIDASTKYTLYHLPFNTLANSPLHPVFPNSNARYMIIYDNYFVFSNQTGTLENFIKSNIRRKNIYAKASYVKVTDFFPSKTNVSLYAEFPQLLYLLQQKLKPEIFDSLSNHLVALDNFGNIGISFYATNNMLNTNIFVTQVPDVEKTNTTLWETMLDTVSRLKPAFVTNHYNHENEIFLQDENNTIYLINKAGRILWKLPLSEKITSDIYQIDYYKNGKLQLLFSTKNFIHLFDRLGNYVERYPIRLRAASDQGLSLFDYANNKQYRICVPGNDRNVYMYNKEGQLLKGWTFDGADHPIITPVQHLRVNTNDYIVFADQARTYILNRRGQHRVSPTKQYALAGNPFYLAEKNSIDNSYITTTDTTGATVKFFLSGKTERNALHAAQANHHYIYHDLNGNGSNEHIYLTTDALTAYRDNGQELFAYPMSSSSKYAPIVFDFGKSDQKIGIVQEQQNKILLINNNGKLYDGFPLDGHAPFSIGHLNNSQDIFNLVVPNENNFLYNYAVH